MTFTLLEYIQQPGKSQTSLLCPASQWYCIWQTEPTDFTGTVLSLRPACLSYYSHTQGAILACYYSHT